MSDGDSDDELVPAVPLKPPRAPEPSPPEPAWLEREERDRQERDQRRRDESAENERRTEESIGRMRAAAHDNGSGFCRYCGVKFTADREGRAMHPANECAGPRPKDCPLCGQAPELQKRGAFRTWELPCGPADHAVILRQQNPATDIDIQRPRRVASDGDDDA